MPPQDPQYQLIDSNGNRVGTLYRTANGEVALHNDTDGSEVTLKNGTLTAPQLTVDPADDPSTSYPYGVERLVVNGNVVAVGGAAGIEVIPAATDNAIQQAFDAINPTASPTVSGEVHLPPTTMIQTAPLKPKPGIDIRTHGGPGGTVVQFTSTGPTAHGIHADAANNLRYCRWDGFTVKGPGRTAQTGVGIKIENTANAHFSFRDQMNVRQWGNHGVHIREAWNFDINGFLVHDVEPEITTGFAYNGVVDIGGGGQPGANIGRIEVYPGANLTKSTESGNAQTAVVLASNSHTSTVRTINVGGVARDMDIRGGWKVERVNWEPDTIGVNLRPEICRIRGEHGAEVRSFHVNNSQNAIAQDYAVRFAQVGTRLENAGLGTVTGAYAALTKNRVEIAEAPSGACYFDGTTSQVDNNTGAVLSGPGTLYCRNGAIS